jgi:outer membrane protein assembly factor BamB
MRLALILAASCLVATAAAADDWPGWMGPQRDGVWRETGILEKFPPGGPKIVWRAGCGAGYAGPAVAEGRVILFDRILAEGAKHHDERAFPQRPRDGIPGKERVVCYDQAAGKQLWKLEYDCLYTISYPSGPRCTPLIQDGKVYTLGAEGHLHCLALKTGEVVWKHDLMARYKAKSSIWGHSAHPLLDGQKLICMVGGEGSAVVAFDKDTGAEIWRSLTTSDIGYCPPSIHNLGGRRTLLIWHSQAAAGLDPETGKAFWTQKLPTYQGMSIAMPQVCDGKVLYTAYPQTCLLLEPPGEGGEPKTVWKGDRQLGLYSVFSTPMVDGGHVYGSSTAGRLTCIEADTGARKWETFKHLRDKRQASAEFFLTRQGKRYFLFTEFGDLIIARLTPAGYEEIDQVNLLPPTTWAFGRDVLWSPPAFAGRCLFARNDNELLCVWLAAEGAPSK